MWKSIDLAPGNVDLELAVIDQDGTHALVFPCRRVEAGWINADTGQIIPIGPTHWRIWADRSENEDRSGATAG